MSKPFDGFDAWNGNQAVSTLFYIYLLKKYKSHCLLYKGSGLVGFHFKFEEGKSTYQDMLSDEAIALLVQCIRKGVSTIIIPVLLVFADENDNISGHANVLIYRKEFQTIEHFEPHGKKFNRDTEMTQRIQSAIEDQIQKLNTLLAEQQLSSVELITSNYTCPRMYGFQALENIHGKSRRKPHETGGGYCVAWSLFFMELALCNPEITSKQLYDRIYALLGKKDDRKMGNYFLDIIRGYTRMMNEKIVKILKLLFDKNFTVKDIHESPDTWENLKEEISLYAEIELEFMNNPQISTEEYIREWRNQLKAEGWEHVSIDDAMDYGTDLLFHWHNIHTNETTSTIPVVAKKIDFAMRIEDAMKSSPITSLSPQYGRPTKKRKLFAKQRSMTTRGMEETNKRFTRSASSQRKGKK